MEKPKEKPPLLPNKPKWECSMPGCTREREVGMSKCSAHNQRVSIDQYMRGIRLEGKPVPKLPQGPWVAVKGPMPEKGKDSKVTCSVCGATCAGRRGWHRTEDKESFACQPCYEAGSGKATRHEPSS